MALPALLGAAGKSLVKSTFGSGKKGAAAESFRQKPSERRDNTERKGGAIVPVSVAETRPTSAIVPFTPTKTAAAGAEGIEGKVERIRVSVVNIESYFKTKIKTKKDSMRKQRVKKEKEKGNLKEQEREANKQTKSKGVGDKLLAKPKGIFDLILGAITKILMGALLMRLLPHFDKLKGILITAVEVGKFLLDWTGKILDGLVTFVSWGIDAYDSTLGWINQNIGEGAAKLIEDISGHIVNIINAAIIIASVAGAMGYNPLDRLNRNRTPRGSTPSGPTTVRPTTPRVSAPGVSPTGRPRPAALIQRKFGHNAANAFQLKYDAAIKAGRSPTQALTTANAHVNKLISSGRITAAPQTGSLAGGKGGSTILKGGFQRSANRFGIKLFGKEAMKGISKVFGRIPIIGPLIVGVSSLLAGEGIGKALFKAFGAALGGFLGSFIPIPVLGTLLGEMVGTYVGDLLHTLIMGGGISEVGKRLQQDLAQALQVGKEVVSWLKGGVGRYFKNFFKENYVPIPGLLGARPIITGIMKTLKMFDGLKQVGYVDGKNEVYRFPNLLQMFNPFKTIPLAIKSFFPPDAKPSKTIDYSDASTAPGAMDEWEPASDSNTPGSTPGSTGPVTASVTSLGSGGGSLKDMKDQDWSDLAYIVSGEAARNTDDEYGVAAAVLNRVSDPKWPNTIMGVGTQKGQFEAVYKGMARREPALARKLKQNQGKIVEALKTLNGRTDFKGQTMLKYKGDTDPMFHPRGNFYHYTSQRAKTDPVPANPPQHWKKLLGPSTGVEFARDTTTTQTELNVPQQQESAAPMTFTPAPAAAPAAAAETSSGGGSTASSGGGDGAGGGGFSGTGAAASQNASAISQMTGYERTAAGMLSTPTMMMIPKGSGGPAGGGGGGGMMSGGGSALNRRKAIDGFFKAQLLGFLQQQ